MRTRVVSHGIVTMVLALGLSSCGSSSGGGTPTSPTTGGGGGNNGPIAATITITAAGVSPSTVTIPAGSRVSFVNNDSRSHVMSSDPHPNHTDCPNIDGSGFLQPGQTGTTGNLTAVRRCGFHDHNDDTNTRLQGAIIVQ